MPRQNRVTPFGAIIATPARGMLMGNRGCLHDSQGTIRRAYQSKRWIICLLDFRQRRRAIMTPGHYTELFFLDEATALAAGHRPCAECQRERFAHFRALWAAANPHLAHTAQPPASVIDEALHYERLQQEKEPAPLSHLPDGSFVSLGDRENAYLILRGELRRWTPFGYAKGQQSITDRPATILTPPSIVRTLQAGYIADLHPSADSR